jgi:hypothetical protein
MREYTTLEDCLAAVQEDGIALKYVPEEFKTPEVCLAAVGENLVRAFRIKPDSPLRYVPEECKTPELCLLAVQQDGAALYFVPGNLRTPEICLAAVREDGEALEFVPGIRTTYRKRCPTGRHYPIDPTRDDIKEGSAAFAALQECCLAAVQNKGRVLGMMPPELSTREICLAAVQSDYTAIKLVPNEFLTEDILHAAILSKKSGTPKQRKPKRNIGFRYTDEEFEI